MKIFTIGFTETSAENFFGRLELAGVRAVVDVRLKADSQLSGFAKKKDLPYFLSKIAEIGYRHEPMLAPTLAMLDDYKKGRISWGQYETQYVDLLSSRSIASRLSPDQINDCCLLCSEALPHKCHRRLVVEYLRREWNEKIEIVHL